MLGVLVAAALAGCSSTVRISGSFDEAVGYYQCPPEYVRAECVSTLVGFLAGREASGSLDDGSGMIRSGNTVLSVLSATDGELVSCFIVKDVGEDGVSSSGRSEHWNLLVSDCEGATAVRAWRHFRSGTVAVPVSDGSREAEFLRALRDRLGECGAPEVGGEGS